MIYRVLARYTTSLLATQLIAWNVVAVIIWVSYFLVAGTMMSPLQDAVISAALVLGGWLAWECWRDGRPQPEEPTELDIPAVLVVTWPPLRPPAEVLAHGWA